MTLTVVDGDFPREVLARKNLRFGEYTMPTRRNTTESYDPKQNGPAGKQEGAVYLGALPPKAEIRGSAGGRTLIGNADRATQLVAALGVFSLAVGCVLAWVNRSRLVQD